MSTAKFDQWLNPNGTENYKTRAWVNFNGTGTVAIRASGNVASITDNGLGDYTVNFTTAMPDANYSAIVIPGITNAPSYVRVNGITPNTTISNTGYRFRPVNGDNNAVQDADFCSVAIFR